MLPAAGKPLASSVAAIGNMDQAVAAVVDSERAASHPAKDSPLSYQGTLEADSTTEYRPLPVSLQPLLHQPQPAAVPADFPDPTHSPPEYLAVALWAQ